MVRQSGLHHGVDWSFHSNFEEDSGAIKNNVLVLHSLGNAETQPKLLNPKICRLDTFKAIYVPAARFVQIEALCGPSPPVPRVCLDPHRHSYASEDLR